MRRNPRGTQTCGLSTWVDGMPSAGTGKVRGQPGQGREMWVPLDVPSLRCPGYIQVKVTDRSGVDLSI